MNTIKRIFNLLGWKCITQYAISMITSFAVSYIYVMFYQNTLENVRILFISHKDFLKPLLVTVSLLAFIASIHYVTATFLSMATRTTYYQLYKRFFNATYFKTSKISHEQRKKLSKSLSDLILILRIIFVMWIPSFFDFILCSVLVMRCFGGYTLMLFLAIYAISSVVFVFCYKITNTINNNYTKSTIDSELFIENIYSQQLNNYIYNMNSVHEKKINALYALNAYNYSFFIYYIILYNVMMTVVLTSWVFCTLMYSPYALNSALLFASVIKTQTLIWSTMTDVLKMLDILQGINIREILFDKHDKIENHSNLHIAKDKRTIKYNDQTINFKPGFNILTGKSGTGKTRLLLKIVDTHKNVIMCQQQDFIYKNSTVLENIICSLEYDKVLFEQIMQDFFHNKFLSNIHKKVSYLSGGERKILNFLRMIYHIEFYNEILKSTYDIILIDEPFNHVDENNSNKMKQQILNIKTKGIIIIVDHTDKLLQDIKNVIKIS
jgi:ABC-type lipoprotein export system ATPase subunit